MRQLGIFGNIGRSPNHNCDSIPANAKGKVRVVITGLQYKRKCERGPARGKRKGGCRDGGRGRGGKKGRGERVEVRGERKSESERVRERESLWLGASSEADGGES
jgi:hypothetical protein